MRGTDKIIAHIQADAKAQADAAKQAKADGGKYCLCPACQAGASILAEKDSLL